MNVAKGRSAKTLMIHNCCALRRIPTMIPALRSAAYQCNIIKKGCGNDDASAGQILGFPRYARGAWVGRTPTPFKKEWRRSRAAPRRCRPSDTNFPHPPKDHNLDATSRSTNLAIHQLAPPWSCVDFYSSPSTVKILSPFIYHVWTFIHIVYNSLAHPCQVNEFKQMLTIPMSSEWIQTDVNYTAIMVMLTCTQKQ
jgi:hypothetical protein